MARENWAAQVSPCRPNLPSKEEALWALWQTDNHEA